MSIPGQHLNEQNTEGCNACPAGTFSGAANSSECTPCSAGAFSGAERSTTCTLCAEGHFAPAAGRTVCHACPFAEFQPAAGQVACESCPTGSNTSQLASTVLEDCICSGGRTVSADRICMFYWRSGVQLDVPITTITTGGEWQECYNEAYQSVTSKTDVVCTGEASVGASVFLYGAKRTDNNTLAVVAMGATRANAINPLPLSTTDGDIWQSPTSGPTGVHLHNGVYWYVREEAFGFSQNESVMLEDQDTASVDCERRVSWALGNLGGYRAGCETSLATSEEWRKVVYFFTGTPGR